MQSKKYRRVALGGTFDPFHRGHKSLIDLAFRLGDEVLIGVSSDELANSLGKAPDNVFRERVYELLIYLESKYRDKAYSIYKLRDPYGPLVRESEIDALIVSPETKARGGKANEIRRERGLKEVELVVVDWVLAEDGKPIRSTRIRKGEIDREGRVLGG